MRAIEQGQRANDGRFIDLSYESSDKTYPLEARKPPGASSAATSARVSVQENPARNAMEGGEVLPEPVEEDE